MIDLTPLEVRLKKDDFRRGRRAVRGYPSADVDSFLDLVAERMEGLVRENMAMSERIARLEEELRTFREREQGLTEALVSAQELREDLRRQAQRDAELTRREAEAVAAEIRAAAAKSREAEEATLRRLHARQSQMVRTYRALLERELAELEVVAQTLELSMDDAAEAVPSPTGRDGVPAGEAVPSPTGRDGVPAGDPAPSPPGRDGVPAGDPESNAPSAANNDEDWLSSVLGEEK